jgi:hypothetical protein
MAGGIVKTALSGVKATGLNVGDGLNLAFGVVDYRAAREEGSSKSVSVAKAVGSFAWGEFFHGGVNRVVSGAVGKMGLGTVASGVLTAGATIALTMLPTAVQLAQAAGEHTTKTMTNAYAQHGKMGSGYFNMTEAGYTMRQRSLNAIRSNGLNTQGVLGNEARTYFRSVQ